MKGSKLLLLGLVLIIKGCSAVNSFSGNTNTTQSYYTESIFLSPESLREKKVHVYFKNSTVYNEFNLEKEIIKSYAERGFDIVKPEDAGLIIQANIKYYGVFDKELLNSIIEDTSKKVFISRSANDNNIENKPPIFNERKRKMEIDFSGFVIGGVGGF